MKYLLLFLISANSYAFTLSSQSTATASVTSTKILDPLSTRDYLRITNLSSNNIYVKLGSAHSTFEGVTIATNSTWEPIPAPVDSIYVKTLSGGAAYTILEGKK